MTIEEKIQDSTVIATSKVSKKRLGLPTKKKKINEIVIFGLTAVYTILFKFIFSGSFIDFNNLWTLDNLMLLAILVNLVLVGVMKITGSTIFALNHYNLYSLFKWISMACKALIFSVGISVAYTALNEISISTYGLEYFKMALSIMPHQSLIVIEGFFYPDNLAKTIALIIPLVSMIPVIIFFITKYPKIWLFVMFVTPLVILIPQLAYIWSRNFVVYSVDESDDTKLIKTRYKQNKHKEPILILTFIQVFVYASVAFIIVMSVI